jgi:hypothetical protein
MDKWLKRAQNLRSEIVRDFLEPESKLLINYRRHWEKVKLPSDDEINADLPNRPGWSSGIEDGTLHGSSFLIEMLQENELSTSKKLSADIRKIYDGLMRAQKVSTPSGFVPRWTYPDGKAIYKECSADQLTILFCSLLRFRKWECANEKDQKDIEETILDATKRCEEYEWKVAGRDGGNCVAGNLPFTRLACVLTSAWQTSGDTKWLNLYDKKTKKIEDELKNDIELVAQWGGYYGNEQFSRIYEMLEYNTPAKHSRLYAETRNRIVENFLKSPIPLSQPNYSEQAIKLLKGKIKISNPFTALKHFRKDIWEMEENLEWRNDIEEWNKISEKSATPPEYISWWHGKRPGICHERYCVIYPLAAFHLGMKNSNKTLNTKSSEAIDLYFDAVDLKKATKIETLLAAYSCALQKAGTRLQ